MKNQAITKISMKVFVVFVAAIMIFSALFTLLSTVSAEGGVFRKNDSIFSSYQNYLDSSVVHKLPSTVKDDDIISVIVEVDSPTLMDMYNKTDKAMSFGEFVNTEEAAALREEINEKKAAYLTALTENGVTYTQGADYANVFAGFEVLFEAKHFTVASRQLGDSYSAMVGEVYNPAETTLVENKVSIYEDTGIFDSSNFPYDGSGMVIAVLDTGLDYTHPAFSMTNFKPSGALGLTKNDVALHIGNTAAALRVPGLTADDVYISDKVPFSFDYADNDADVYSMHNNHGTHVSGVIVGHDDVITGVAPNAQLVSMKIFSDTMESARASWILSALEDCVELGVDVINMSLGTACGFSREIDNMKMAEVYDAIREQGISLVVAASNSFASSYGSEKNGNLGLTSNPDTGTVGSPSTYPGALSIASIDGTKTPYILDAEGKIIYFVEASDSAGEEKFFFDDLLGNDKDIVKELEYVLIPGVGNPSDYNGIDVAGKVALVRRGSNTFEEKAKAAQNAGAVALIVYNNTSGDIRMNVGIVNIPVCSISQDDGEKMAKAKRGTIKVAHSQASGPFMSDFSSWGPTPSLEIKPEITAHGGNILSAVTGHGYDRLSGTSMACPNMSGVVALMRQYVINEFPRSMITDEHGNIDYVEVNAVINRLLMSTADVVYNKNGLPYAVRKQGAGLANLAEASGTKAYILTYKEGEVMDKTKVELGHDPEKTGVYSFNFTIVNFGASTLSYDISATVMTEGVSDTPTYKGDTVVTQEGYLLNGAKFEIVSVSGGSQNGNTVTVAAGSSCQVSVKIALSDEDKQYMDESFENGMYIEGFLNLEAKDEGSTDLGLPYLAFYGNWYTAPLFDIDYFETNADELNDAMETLDKTLPDAYATRPVGGIADDYVSYLGSYYFVQDPKNKIISANRDYIAISNTTDTVRSLRFVWGGQLRNAEKIEITITDSATGEVVFQRTEVSVRKSYGDGGSYIYPTNIDIEFDAAEQNLRNNARYDVKLQGYLEYGDGGVAENKNSTFEFPLYVDFEAPALTDCEFYTEYDKQAKKTRLFAKMAVYDNHYAMAMQVGYVGVGEVEGQLTNMIYPFDQHMTPIYSEKNGTTYVTYELTDHIFDIKNEKSGSYNKNTFAVVLYDYAMNDATYEIELPDDFADFYLEETEITLNSYETYTISANVYPEREWDELLEFSVSSSQNVVRIVNNKIIALPVTDEQIEKGKNVATVFIHDKKTDKEAVLTVRVVNDKKLTKPVADVFELTGYDTLFAFYIMSNDERDIGQTGDRSLFEGNYNLSLFPNEKVKVNYKLDAFFPDETTVEFLTGNEGIVQVDQEGNIIAVSEGYTSVTVRVLQNGKPTLFTKSISIEVKDPYVRSGPTLNNYYGAGTANSGKVNIPADMLFTKIGQYAFSNYNYIPKDLEAGDVINDEDSTATKIAYIGNDFITEVIIPEGVESIGPYAFAGLTELRRVVLPSTLETIEYGAFFGCTKLTEVEGLEHVKLINKYAFQSCDIQNDLTMNNIHAIGDYAFAGNTNLEAVSFPKTLSSIGAYAFMGNLSLTDVDVSRCGNIKYGPYVFLDCQSLEEITMNTSVIPTGAFYGCKNLKTLHIGKDVSSIGEYALSGTKITSFSVAEGNTTYRPVAEKKYLLSADGKTLLMVAPGAEGSFGFDPNLDSVTAIGYGAFAGNKAITDIHMPNITYVGDYAFSECRALTTVTLGNLRYIGDYAFLLTNIKSLPSFGNSELTEIGDYAFAFTLIERVDIKAGMTVGNYAFAECSKLHTVTVGDGAKLGEGVFLRSANREDPRKNDGSMLNIKISPLQIVENGKTFNFYYIEYLSALKNVTIGQNVDIGTGAFLGAAKLERVTLGAGATIGELAFYNCPSLKEIDLSGVKRIGNMAFSGNSQIVFSDAEATTAAVVDGIYTRVWFYAAPLTAIDLSSLEADGLGEQAFAYCKELVSVKLGESLKQVPYMAFAGCEKLQSINLQKVEKIGDGAFFETALVAIDLSSAKEIGNEAFASCLSLTDVIFCADGASVMDKAFADDARLVNVTNLDCLTHIGAYAFAYTDLRGADLTGALTVGDYAFIKDEMTDYVFTLTLGEKLETLGDNPFAMCRLSSIYRVVDVMFNGNKVGEEVVYTFDINPSLKIINGSLYTVVPNGLKLTTYIGLDQEGRSLDRTNVVVAEGTVRVAGMAFAGSDVVRVTLPYSMKVIGHKAFYACGKLTTVTFKSYTAPALEEELDVDLCKSFQNLPSTGEYEVSYNEDLNGNGVIDRDETIDAVYPGLGIVPYYMWNIHAEKYNNVYYGANFVDRIGYVSEANRNFDNMGNLVMIAPSNGEHYDSFIYAQYFSDRVAGDVVADAVTMNAINAIDRLPDTITPAHKALVEAARAAYDKVTSPLQQVLVTNYDKLRRAEKLLAAYNGGGAPDVPDTPGEDPIENPAPVDGGKIALIVVVVIESLLLVAGGVAAGLYFFYFRKKGMKMSEEGVEEQAEQTVCLPAEEAREVVEEPAAEAEEKPAEEIVQEEGEGEGKNE